MMKLSILLPGGGRYVVSVGASGSLRKRGKGDGLVWGHVTWFVHISRVRSVDLDTWTPEQIEHMQRWGNRRANLYWEGGGGTWSAWGQVAHYEREGRETDWSGGM
jgi:hypothetical protein